MAAVDDGASFDFVIIGAGSAGCVLANRLSENPATSVCVLEAGGPDGDYRIAMPAGALDLASRAGPHNWAFETTAQDHLDGRKLFQAAGRGWGGSSSIGSMIYLRGAPGDYNAWAVDGWAFADLLAYFKRAERVAESTDHGKGQSGPLRVAAADSKSELSRAFIEAAGEAGYKRARDFNGASREGAGYWPLNLHEHARCSAADAYLKPVSGIRSNLNVISHAFAMRVVTEGGRASGVEYATGAGRRVKKIVRARREIIIAAGALASPKLLMLSGIGDAQALSAFGILPLVSLREVGRNLQDHFAVNLAYECPLPLTHFSRTKGTSGLTQAAQYRLRRKGSGRFAPIEAGGLFKTRGELAAPDIAMHMIAALPPASGRARPDKDGFTISVSAMRPESRGRVRLAGPDPFAAPLIDPDYLSSDTERRALRDGVRMAREIAAKPGLSLYRGRELAPGPSVRTDGETDYWIRRNGQSLHHHAGTCRMGVESSAVLDPRLRVRGVEALRVVDASAMPTLIGADPQATVIAMAERAADLILGRSPLR